MDRSPDGSCSERTSVGVSGCFGQMLLSGFAETGRKAPGVQGLGPIFHRMMTMESRSPTVVYLDSHCRSGELASNDPSKSRIIVTHRAEETSIQRRGIHRISLHPSASSAIGFYPIGSEGIEVDPPA